MNQIPLPERMRPKSLEEYIGQEHLIGEKGILRPFLEKKELHSMIFWGSPGVGKTTLARLLAKELGTPFYQLNAVNSGVKDVRETIIKANNDKRLLRITPLLFIDEIHRFSKSQQDSLLKAVEEGTFILIGATTENPSFEIISPLLSRCQVYVLNPLSSNELKKILKRALETDKILSMRTIELKEDSKLLSYSGGDARKLLAYLDLVVSSQKDPIKINNTIVKEVLKSRALIYDKKGEFHYDTISAFIKSVRGSDPQAAIYYLAQMLEGGEEPRFIARRLLILSAEDIGLANPSALIIAQSVFDTVHVLGMPEARIPLSELTIYLATSQKSNSAYLAIDCALEFVRQNKNYPVPLHLRNAPTKLMKNLEYGKNYKYAHSYKDNFAEQEYLPEEIKGTTFYIPQTNIKEDKIKNSQKKLWREKYEF